MAEIVKNLSWVNKRHARWDVTFGEAFYAVGGSVGPRIQRDYQLVLLHSGEVIFELEKDTFELRVGEVALLHPGGREFIRFSRKGGTHHTWCSVFPKVVSPSLRRALKSVPSRQGISQGLERIMQAGLGMPGSDIQYEQEVILSLGISALWEYLRSANVQEQALGSTAFHQARSYLDTHLGEENCLRKCAAAISVTPQHLTRIFRQQMETTPGRYLWGKRLAAGLRLLRVSGLSIGEISTICGFKNPFHFSRLVRNETGISPRQWRQKIWSGDQAETYPY